MFTADGWSFYCSGTIGNYVWEDINHDGKQDGEMDGPEDCGIPEGDGKDNESGYINDWTLEGMVDINNTLNCTPDDSTSSGTDRCEFFSQEGTECEKRPTAISLSYLGGNYTNMIHNQDPDKVSCEDFQSLVEPVQIIVSKDDGSNITLDTVDANVYFGDVVEALAANADRSDFDSASLQENSKDDTSGLVNEWLFEGMAGNGLTLDCSSL